MSEGLEALLPKSLRQLVWEQRDLGHAAEPCGRWAGSHPLQGGLRQLPAPLHGSGPGGLPALPCPASPPALLRGPAPLILDFIPFAGSSARGQSSVGCARAEPRSCS